MGRATVIGLAWSILLGIGGLAAPADAEPSAPDRPGVRSAATSPGADFNGDGYSDLATAGDRDPEDGSPVGVIRIRYGSTDGLTTANAQVWTEHTFEQKLGNQLGDTLATGDLDFFGWSLAAADFGRADRGAGLDDLAIVVSGERVGKVSDAGAVQVIYGSTKGLRARGSEAFNRASSGVLGTAHREAQVGRALAVGDFGRTTGGRPLADLALAGRDEGVNILYGARAGLSTGNDQFLSELGFVLTSS